MSNEKSTEKKSIVDAVFDLGLAWVELGLAQGTNALQHTSAALAKTARSLDAVREALKNDETPKAA